MECLKIAWRHLRAEIVRERLSRAYAKAVDLEAKLYRLEGDGPYRAARITTVAELMKGEMERLS